MIQSMCVDFFSDRVGESPRVKSREGVHKIKGAEDSNNSQKLIRCFEVNSKTPNTYMFESEKKKNTNLLVLRG